MTSDFLTDDELIRRLGLPEKDGRVAIAALDKNPKFPAKDALFGYRRYFPAVKAFLDWRYGLTMSAPARPDGEEKWNETDNQRRTRTKVA